jgi:hydrogenase maturation protease
MGELTSKLLVIGLGNPILTDDAIGWRVAGALRERLRDHGDESLAELMVDHTRAIVIDATMTRDGVPGTVYTLKLTDLPGTLNTASAHDTNLATALAALRRFGAVVPDDSAIDIVTVEAEEVMTFSEECTPAVEASIPAATETVFQLIRDVTGLRL